MSKGKEQHSTSPAFAAPTPATDRRLIRFAHFKQRGICENRERLTYLIENQGFPPGFWTGPNTHVWWEDVVEAWLSARPIERPPTNQARPRKRKTSDRGASHEPALT
jgi:hypothetical protein